MGDNTCGLVAQDVTSRVRNVLSGARLRIDPTSSGRIYVNVTIPSSCLEADVSVAVKAPATVWYDATRVAGGPDMRQQVLDAVGGLTKRLVDDWNGANRCVEWFGVGSDEIYWTTYPC
jgi:hypothetical protein